MLGRTNIGQMIGVRKYVDVCQGMGAIDVSQGVYDRTFTLNPVRPGKRLLFWLDNNHISVTNLTVNIDNSVAETIFNNQIIGQGGFALVKPKTSILTGKITAWFDGGWGSGVAVFEVPDDLEGIIKPMSGSGVTQDLSELGVPPFHFIASNITSVQEPISEVQRYAYIGVSVQDVSCENTYFTPTWVDPNAITNWIMY